ncbi:hypothetical protein ACQCSX_22140 (plasmid) [Pseudarthrobacter sp. P1]|uniref:hypothetical protein n=1 Tax=Pseudarthrobacter sp. P1 TaxID=3418418 RepID=UPI003CFB0371
MTTNTVRQPAGIPAGGQFAATSHAEPGVSLAPAAPEPKNPDWHALADQITANGARVEKARSVTAQLVSLELVKAYAGNSRAALDAGAESSSAMYLIAASSLQTLAEKLEKAGEDPAALRSAVTSARRSLSRTGSLLDGFHPTGRQPIFREADTVLGELETFLTFPSPDQNG